MDICKKAEGFRIRRNTLLKFNNVLFGTNRTHIVFYVIA